MKNCKKTSKIKILSVIAGLIVVSFSAGGAVLGVLHNKRKLEQRIINLENEIPISMRTIGLLYTENQEEILNYINYLRKTLKTKESHIDIELKDVTVQFNRNVPSVTITAKKESKNVIGSIEIKFNKKDISTLELNVNMGALNSNDENAIIDAFIRNNAGKLDTLVKTDFVLEDKNDSSIILKVKDDHQKYQGSIQLNFTVKKDISTLNLNKNVGTFESFQQNAIIEAFINNNRTQLAGLTKDSFTVVSSNNGKLTIGVKSDNTQYQGTVEISYSVIQQFNGINDIVKNITNLKNNDKQSVLNRFFELNKTLFEQENVKITKNQLEVVVNDDVATITVNGNGNVRGSIEAKLSLSRLTNSYLNVLSSDDPNHILKEINNQNSWDLNSNDLNIEVNGKDAIITGKENKNKKFIGTINFEFGFKATYTPDKKELKRIGFFKNLKGEWQIEQVYENTNKVVAILPTFINSLESAFQTNKNSTITGLESWNTSNVTNMSKMFWAARNFNQPLNFNTSNVTNMSEMFWHARNFNQPLNFNTSKVTDMSGMFNAARNFNQPLNFNTSNVTNMSQMFFNCWDFNQPLNTWDVSNVNDMSQMFQGAFKFNQNISSWDVRIKDPEKFNNFNASGHSEFTGDKLPEAIRKLLN
ncbi:BspA family leucine-rich repeat surface protein [Mycoplasma yeatsii]|uniref:Surface protein n=1 Tax=Mycoplasma yeatsii TaxID=51365 RepID=A0ABU0NES9_9MOLU|nr:BspA family leucine-rich repeat surface protein [Mycoplasma yeatsii]MDQ0567948.1 surface protein [Mycoplasma yeatsii]